jgi:hypothetical protein
MMYVIHKQPLARNSSCGMGMGEIMGRTYLSSKRGEIEGGKKGVKGRRDKKKRRQTKKRWGKYDEH